MRAVGLVRWPLQTAFVRCAAGALIIRGGGERGGRTSLCSGFHALSWSGLHHHDYLRKKQHRATCQRKQVANVDPHGRQRNRGPQRLIVRCLNRIMLEPSEVVRGEDGGFSATLGAADSRAAHVRSVLKAKDGQSIRVGVVDAGLVDNASISWREPIKPPEGSLPPDISGRNKNQKAASEWKDLALDLGTGDQLLERVPQERRPKVALMLAVPRPLQLNRILPMVSSLGVTTLVLCMASKVEKMYFGSHLFRNSRSMREKLVEGLSQCGDTALPEIVIARHLNIFLEDDLEKLFPKDRWVRTVAHPTRLPAQERQLNGEEMSRESTSGGSDSRDGKAEGVAAGGGTILVPGLSFAEVNPPKGCDPADAGVLVTVGPEGGWVEPDELELLQSFGFQAVTLGSRVLRSDVAICALLALAHAWVEERKSVCGPSPSLPSLSSPPAAQ